MNELKPCPRCGATRGLYVLYDEHDMEWFVFCDGCKTSLHNEYNDTREEAVRIWNRRAERTCRNDAIKQDQFVCTRCGVFLDIADMSDESCESSYEPNFCPDCGSRVVR